MKNIGVFISGGGSNLQAIIDGIDNGDIKARISFVVSSREGVYGLERARERGIPYAVVSKGDYRDSNSFGNAILKLLEEGRVDMVVLAGYLNILPTEVVEKYRNRIINVHPSLIPAFCGQGYYGKRVHQAVLDHGVKITGATVHFEDEGTDTGPILMQKPVEVLPEDDVNTLAERVLKVEHQLLPKALKLLVEGRILVDGRRVIIS